MHSGVLKAMIAQGRMVDCTVLPASDTVYQHFGQNVSYVLAHPRLETITYPYEWSFLMLQAAALAHLDLQLALLEKGYGLSDASAFNMQFVGAHPLHIDTLSVIPYQDNSYWAGYRQFLKHFLNPLLLESATGVSFAPWFRSSIDGLASENLVRLLPWHQRLYPAVFMHVVLPAWGEHRSGSRQAQTPPAISKTRHLGMLNHLRNLTASLKPRIPKSGWHHYSETHPYAAASQAMKQKLVAEFAARNRPRLLLDIGCNTGHYAQLALEHGAASVVGLDNDRASIDAAFTRSKAHNLSYLPLVMDIINPSPSQGWQLTERSALWQRVRPDSLLALAVLHHLSIGHNIPLASATQHLVSLAPRGLIEFIPKNDPKVQDMLALREDHFQGYTLEAAREALTRHATLVKETPLGDSHRVLFEFVRAV